MGTKQKTINTTSITDQSVTDINTDNSRLDVASGATGVTLSDTGAVTLSLSDQGAVSGALSFADSALGSADDSLDRAQRGVEVVNRDAFAFARGAQADTFRALSDVVTLAGDITKGVTASAFDTADKATAKANTSTDERLTKTIVIVVGLLGAVVVFGAMKQ